MVKDIKNNGLQPSLSSRNPIAATLISKFTRDRTEQPMNVGSLNLSDIAHETNYKITNNDDILTMFPDVELAIQILTASILSPNDMIKTTLTYTNPNIRMPSNVSQTILTTIEEYIESNYNLNAKLSNILKEALCTKGAYIEAIIPEASVDDVISQQNFIDNNAGIESYFKSTGQFLSGDTSLNVNISKETFKVNIVGKESNNIPSINITEEDLRITITDNYKILNLSKLLVGSLRVKNKKKLKRYSIGTESNTNDNIVTPEMEAKQQELDNIFRDKTYYEQQDYVKINTADDASRKSITKPLILKLPIQSVIPVHVTGEPSKHLGYFVMLDENGNPLQYSPDELEANSVEYYSSSNLEQDTRLNLITKARNNLIGNTSNDIMLDGLESIYTQLVDNMLKKKLENSDYKDLVELEKHTELYRVMLFRALKYQQTKVVFIPEELVAYYAFEYRDNGTGKSLLEKSSIFFSLKAILLFSRVMASLKNGTSITEITANLDENDTDPQGRIEQIKSEVLKTRQSALPLGVIRPDDLADWVQKNGLRFKFTHPSLTDLDISTSDMTTSKAMPDDELETKLNEYIYMSLFLTPEIVEAGYSTDYATTVVAKQLLFAKRIIRLQDTFCSLLTDHIRKLLVNDVVLINEIKEVVKENLKHIRKFITKIEDNPLNPKKKDNKSKVKISNTDIEKYVIDSFLNEIQVTLPEPEVDKSTNIKQSFDEYKTMLEETLDVIFNTSAIPNDYVGNIADKVDSIKEMYKAAALMRWMAENGYMEEISEAITKDEEGNYIFNPLEDYSHFLESISESFLPFIKRHVKIKQDLDEKLEKAETPPDETSSDTDTDTEEEDTEDTEDTDTNEEEGGEGEEDDATDGDGDAADALKSMDNMDADGNDTGGDDMGDMDSMDDSMDTDTDSGNKGNADDMEKLQALLLKEKIDKERALAERAKAEAIDKMKKYGITPDELTEMSKSNVKVNPNALRIERPPEKTSGGDSGGGEDEFGMGDDEFGGGDEFADDMGDAGSDEAGDALASMDNMDTDGTEKDDKDKDKEEDKKEDKKEDKEGESKEDVGSYLRTRRIFRI